MTAAEALGYVRAKWEEFLDLYPEILNLQHRAATAAYAAGAAGDAETHDAAQLTIERLGNLAQLHNEAVADYERLAAVLPGLGAVAIPIAYAGAVIALAGVVGYVLAKMSGFRQVVTLLEAGRITPQEAHDLLGDSPLSSIGRIVQWGLIGTGAFLALRAYRELRA